jgi:hypothetical protein
MSFEGRMLAHPAFVFLNPIIPTEVMVVNG